MRSHLPIVLGFVLVSCSGGSSSTPNVSAPEPPAVRDVTGSWVGVGIDASGAHRFNLAANLTQVGNPDGPPTVHGSVRADGPMVAGIYGDPGPTEPTIGVGSNDDEHIVLWFWMASPRLLFSGATVPGVLIELDAQIVGEPMTLVGSYTAWVGPAGVETGQLDLMMP